MSVFPPGPHVDATSRILSVLEQSKSSTDVVHRDTTSAQKQLGWAHVTTDGEVRMQSSVTTGSKDEVVVEVPVQLLMVSSICTRSYRPRNPAC